MRLLRALAPWILATAAVPGRVLPSAPATASSGPSTPAKGPSSTLDIRSFGADPQQPARTDEAFRGAVRAARGLAGATIRIPTGQFTITRPIELGPDLADVALTGEGRASAIRAMFPGPAIIVAGGAHLSVRNLRITGRFSKGVFVTGRSRAIVVDRCWIDGATDDDAGRVDSVGGVVIGDADDVSVTDSVFEHNGSPSLDHGADVFALSGSNHARLRVTGNRCSSTDVTFNIGLFNTSWSLVDGNVVQGARVARSLENAGYGIMLYRVRTAESGHNVVSSNVVTDTQGSGIYLQNSPFSTVVGNTIARTASRQLDVKLNVGGIAVAPEGPVAIVGNSISGSLKAGISVGGSGNTVAANVIDDPSGPGIYLRDARNTTVSDNSILHALVGIRSLSPPPPEGLTIRGNQIVGSSGAGMSLQGLRRSVVDGNQLSDNGGDALSLADGEDNRISGNLLRGRETAGAPSCPIRFVRCRLNKVFDNQSSDRSTPARLLCTDDASADNVVRDLGVSGQAPAAR